MAGAKSQTKRLFKVLPRGTNLEDEIGIARLEITELREMMNNGDQWISAGVDGEGKSRMLLVSDLLEKRLGTLNALIRTQAENHPEKRVGGNLTLTIQVSEIQQAMSDDVSESLEADQKELPANVQTIDAPVAVPAQDSKFGELDDDA